ncbi:MAG: serine hydrolase [Variibacter sp.]
MPSIDDLEMHLRAVDDDAPFTTGWSVLDFRTRRRWTKDGATPVPSASTRKIAILMACLKEVHVGNLSLDDRVVIEARHQQNDSGILRSLRPNLTISLYDALTLMIIVSDNAGTATVVERVGLHAVNALCESLGLVGTRHVASAPANSFLTSPTPDDLTGINTVTPDDMIVLLAAIVAGATDDAAAARIGVTPDLCRLAIDIMEQQQFRHGLPKLLPTGTVVAHKTGGGPSNESDAGIVYHQGKPLYAIAIYTHHNPVLMPDGSSGRAAARDHIAAISFACWNAITAETFSL